MNSLQHKTWKDFVPELLLCYCTNFFNRGLSDTQRSDYKRDPNPIHILVVEGHTDRDFYQKLLENYIIVDSQNKKRLEIKKSAILCDLLSDDMRKNNMIDSFELNRILKQINEDEDDYSAYGFVCECIKSYERDINCVNSKLKKYNIYGLIDEDFGHDVLINNLKNISSSEYHDREMCSMRFFMPDYFDVITKNYDEEKKTRFLKIYSEIISFCFKQGILEKTSFEFQANNAPEIFEVLKLKAITHHYFLGKREKRFRKVDFRNFDFDKFINERSTRIDNPFLISYFDNFINDFNDNIKKMSFISNRVFDLIKKWLLGKNLTVEDNNDLDTIFKYCNGHLVLNQMILCGNNLFGFNEDEDYSKRILNDIVIEQNKYKYLFDSLPLSKYKEYRLINNMYKVL